MTSIVDEIKSNLNGLDFHHLQLLGVLNNGHALFHFFLTEPDVLGQIGVLTQEMQGNPINQSILNDLSVVHDFLRKVFPSLVIKNKSPPTFVEFRTNIVRERNSERTTKELHQAIRSCIDHVSEIMTWFGGALNGVNADKVVANVIRYMKDGHFVIRSPRHPLGNDLELVYQTGSNAEEVHIRGFQLQEQVRAAVFVRGDKISTHNNNDLTDDQLEYLNEFVESYELALKLISDVSDAEVIGTPNYQTIELHTKLISAQELFDLLDSVRRIRVRWESQIKNASFECNRLSLLSRLQILQVMHLVKQSNQELNLLPYLQSSYPEGIHYLNGNSLWNLL